MPQIFTGFFLAQDYANITAPSLSYVASNTNYIYLYIYKALSEELKRAEIKVVIKNGHILLSLPCPLACHWRLTKTGG